MNRTGLERIAVVVARHRIVYGVMGALTIASILTLISMALYVSSGASRLDLSRPGYEQVRKEAQHTASTEQFSASGPIDSAVLNDFQSRYTTHRETLKKLDTFASPALDDGQLQIVPSAPQ